MTDKTIRYSVDGREAQDYQSKMRESSQRMAVEMVNYARSQSTSAKETLRLIEEQIKAIEKRNKLDNEMAMRTAQQQFQTGRITQTDLTRATQQLQGQASDDNIQIKLLRELIDVTRITSREEIRTNRESAEKFAKGDFGSDELENLRKLQTRSQLDSPKTDPTQSMHMPGAGGQLMTSLATGNLGGIASGLMMILGAGGVATALAGIAINTTRQYEQEIQGYAVATQTPVNELLTSRSVSSMRNVGLGLSGTEMMQKQAELIRSYGGKLNLADGTVEGLLGAGISRGISDQAINQLMSISRFSGTPALGTIGNLEGYLEKMSRPLIRLPEMLDIYLQKSNEILQRGGVLYAEGLQQTMMSMSTSYGVEGYNLNRMMGSIGGALGPNSSNPIMEALKLQTLQELYPNMSQWERFGIMEHAMSNPDYIKAMIGKVKGLGGSSSTARFMTADMFGTGFEDTNRLYEGDFNIEQIQRHGKTTQERTDEFSEKYEVAGKEMVGEISKLLTQMGLVKDIMVESVGIAADHAKNSKKYFEDTQVYRNEVTTALRDFK